MCDLKLTEEQIISGIAKGVQNYLEKAEERKGKGEKPLDRFEKGVAKGTENFFEDFEEKIELRIDTDSVINNLNLPVQTS